MKKKLIALIAGLLLIPVLALAQGWGDGWSGNGWYLKPSCTPVTTNGTGCYNTSTHAFCIGNGSSCAAVSSNTPAGCTTGYPVIGDGSANLVCGSAALYTIPAGGPFLMCKSADGLTVIQCPSSSTLPASTAATNMVLTTPALGTPSALVATNITGIPAAQIPPTPTVTGASGPTIVTPRQYYICTTTCAVALPAPTTAGYEYCIRNANNVNTVITLSNIASNYFELPAKTGYTASGKGLHTSAGAVTDQICVVSDGANHYLIMNYSGAWVTN